MYVFDKSPSLGIALVASQELRDPQYVPLEEAPDPLDSVDLVYLRQLHAVANGVAIGVTVISRRPFQPAEWDVAGACLVKR